MNLLESFNQSVYTLTLYEVMVGHSGLGLGQPVNVGFAIDRRNGDLGLNMEDTERKRHGVPRDQCRT